MPCDRDRNSAVTELRKLNRSAILWPRVASWYTAYNTSQILQILLSYMQHDKGKAHRQVDPADTENEVSLYSRRYFAANKSP